MHSFIKQAVDSICRIKYMDEQVLVDALCSNNSSMIARIGSVEIKGVLYPLLPMPVRYALKNVILRPMETNAGFFPATVDSIERFSRLMLDDIGLLDVLGSWRIEEYCMRNYLRPAKLVQLKTLEPYLSNNPWSQVLVGKKVLVVHPFSSTIERQYHENRRFLFADKRVLPSFESIRTIKAVQTIAGEKSEFRDWFEALESMKIAIDSCDYDVAIIGCGAYGLPLAAHVKRQGKKAIHLGGATQILFGIRGRRWDGHPVISKLYNEYWVRPHSADVPKNAMSVEAGCYW